MENSQSNKIELPESDISVSDISSETLESQYIQSMTIKEKKAYIIAKTHLMSSFSLKKSNGYIHFTEANKKDDIKT